ncbi:MAG: phosphoglycerate kinase [Clostridia bacterium]|nr:phosphoglycerate kinase [Clostridia bacterium]
MKKSIKELDVKGKKVLLRLDLNVPLNKQTGEISDDTRIMESLSTINYLCENGAKLIVCSHLGRPEGVDKKYSLKVVADKLGKLVKNTVLFAEDTVGKDAKDKAKKLAEGEILVLENLRFDKREEENDEKFCKELASLAEIYVNDAFGTAHRKHASTYGVAKLLPNAVGFLMNKEIKVISQILENPQRPFVAILGGAKIKDKIPVIENLIGKADAILVGGGMAYTFQKALGGTVGTSLVDDEKLELAKELIEKAKAKNVEFVLPVDNMYAKEFSNDSKGKKCVAGQIPDGFMGLDIGPKTAKLFAKYIKKAGTIVWNGPLGVFEFSNFAKGTNKIAKAIAKSKGFSFIGGGDSASAIVKSGYAKQVSHISTGGGASLNMLEGKILPGVDVIAEV